MGSLTGTQNRGYALMEQWQFTITNSGATGTRVYLDTDIVLANSSKENIPKIGDSWSDDYPDVVVKSLGITYVNNSDECGKKITVSYGPWSIEMEVTPQSEDDLLKNVSVTGEFISWEPKNTTFQWLDDSDPVVQPLFLNIAKAGVQIYRVIRDFDAYMYVVMSLVNKVNASEFLGFPAESVLFTGANCSEFKNRSGSKRWKVELLFTVRSCTGDYTDGNDGWNFLLREDTGTWDKPVTADAFYSTLYESTSFEILFTADPLGEDEDLFEFLPDQ